ncbi:hypothetical protein QMK33_04220 [Hymenobacter sp. H14-R3]|uniref:hypothetical protein n=1 Tax=Hymenobacter sp. H14-R3 TaxID=3046308 RepID=UPI0024B8B5A3|nr:hypothetical protein [Hymenobacter sp. H14-R3]MDJ0364345.1 hypothetical protein [Hymenobacter sp. H14-R3]
MIPAPAFVVTSSFRVPGLGLLVLPAPPAPAWLGAHPLHTTLLLRLHRPGQPPLALPATIEELARADEPPTRALLLDADPGGILPAGTWLQITDTEQNGLL